MLPADLLLCGAAPVSSRLQAGNFSRKFSEKFTANLSWGYIFGFWKSTLKKVNTDLTGETWSSLTPNVFVIYSINK